jgi:hypothetical protein
VVFAREDEQHLIDIVMMPGDGEVGSSNVAAKSIGASASSPPSFHRYVGLFCWSRSIGTQSESATRSPKTRVTSPTVRPVGRRATWMFPLAGTVVARWCDPVHIAVQ